MRIALHGADAGQMRGELSMDELLMRAVAAEKLVDGDPESCHQQEAHTLWTALALRDAAQKLQETCRVLMERDCEGCPLLQDGRCVCGVSPVT